MRVTIYQPQYFPRLHYFNRILNTDIFVILDSAQYTKSLIQYSGEVEKRHTSYQSTTPIKTPASNNLLSIPVRHTGQLNSINETRIDYSQNFQKIHLAALKNNYGRAFQYPDISMQMKGIIMKQYSSLADLNIQTILWGINELLGFNIPLEELSIDNINEHLENSTEVRLKKIIRDRDLGVSRPEGLQQGTDWTIAICKEVNADEYFYGGTAEKAYMSLDKYKENGIGLVRQDWLCKEYPQQLPKLGFVPNLSIMDLLFNVSRDNAQKIINFPSL